MSLCSSSNNIAAKVHDYNVVSTKVDFFKNLISSVSHKSCKHKHELMTLQGHFFYSKKTMSAITKLVGGME